MSTKCIAVHLPIDLLERINDQKTKTGQSQNGLITRLIEKGIGYSGSDKATGKMFFFVKVKLDTTRMIEFGQKLQKGEIDTSHTMMTYCIKDDPTTGLNFWYADSMADFEKVLDQYRPFYKEIEVIEVVTPMNAMKMITENIGKKD